MSGVAKPSAPVITTLFAPLEQWITSRFPFVSQSPTMPMRPKLQQMFNRGIYIAGDLVYGDDDVLAV